MREFKALVTLGDLLCGDDTPEEVLAAFDDIRANFLGKAEAPESRAEQHLAIYRRWVGELLPENWLEEAERILRGHSRVWIDYIASLNEGDMPADERLELLLELRKHPDFEPTASFQEAAKALRDECVLKPASREPSAAPEKGAAKARPATTAKAASGTPSPEAPDFFTQSQRDARDRILALARLNFDTAPAGRLRPRTSALIVAPTGSGKTALLRSVAETLGAHLVRLSIAEWIPVGASRDLTPALLEVAEALAAHARVVVFIDELDKIVDDGRSWSRSAAIEMFNLLERSLPTSVFGLLRKGEELRPLIEERLPSGMFIAGAGAWQSLHQVRPKPVIGFQGRYPAETSADLLLRAIRDAGFPAELAGRFHASPIPLPYPSAAETTELFNRIGITDLAARLGLQDRLRDFAWEPFGFRSLESLWADLLLAEREIRRTENGICLP